ncbi:hypothetical protein ACFYY1_39085 [Streptomyces sp. NPDC001890]|uniref:hypothetical protein n=1 Tax=Streptomyces sp. NPDC001890 TaxID=3364620 RepID=UPI0036C9F5B8
MPDTRTEEIHKHFGLSYANYLVIPRTLLQSMPDEWQTPFVALLNELDEAFQHVPQAEAYEVTPGKWRAVDDMTTDEMHSLNTRTDTLADGTPYPKRDDWYDQDPDEQHFLEDEDPVPHYNRGRTHVEPRTSSDPHPVQMGRIAPNAPQPAEGLRQHLAEAMAMAAGSKAFIVPGPAREHPRSQWLAHADATVNALHRWEQEGTLARLCTIPGCFHQLNIASPHPGWLHSRAVGYACPNHAAALWSELNDPHIPDWQYTDERAVLRCSCGWDAGRTRFRGHGTTLWQVHVLSVLESTDADSVN